MNRRVTHLWILFAFGCADEATSPSQDPDLQVDSEPIYDQGGAPADASLGDAALMDLEAWDVSAARDAWRPEGDDGLADARPEVSDDAAPILDEGASTDAAIIEDAAPTDQRPLIDVAPADAALIDAGSVEGCDVFSAPIAAVDADGSRQRPWGSLASLASANQLDEVGGTLCLLDGHHGAPTLVEVTGPLVIRALNPQGARVSALTLQNSDHITFEDLLVDGEDVIDPTQDERIRFLVLADEESDHITLRGLTVQSAARSDTWTWDDWRDRVRSGVDLRGAHAAVEGCLIQNTYHALSARGDHAYVGHTTIDNFGGDGIRGLGSSSTYEWNTVRDAYIDEYEVQHDDAFQTYELEGDLLVEGVTIRHNRFILFADPITDFVRSEALVGTLMQGIINTDGYVENWVVENNLVINSQAHGITLHGARHCRIQNNTVIRHPAFEVDSGPWVRITDQNKTGQRNFENVIRNNLTTMLTPWDYDVTSTVEANVQVDDAARYFIDLAGLDLHLAPGTDAIDTGVDFDLTDVDLDGRPRRVGAAVDLGAFERP